MWMQNKCTRKVLQMALNKGIAIGDVLQHLYLGLQGTSPLAQRMQTALQQMAGLQALYTGGNQIFITEAGWEGSVADSLGAAGGCQTLFTVSKGTGAVAASCWFTLVDFAGHPLGLWAGPNNPKHDLLAAYQQTT
jgi:hypothetical protein